MTNPIVLEPVGHVRSSRAEAIDDGWDSVEASNHLDGTKFGADALAGLDAFSHVQVVFFFHGVPESAVISSARHPRGRSDWPRVGIFAQRGKNRPNRIGVTICRLVRVDGLSIVLQGLDAIDGTPVLDIKPCMRGFVPRGEIREPAWCAELMKDYW